MSGVFISIGARAAVAIREFVRDGKAPVAELQNRLAETIGHGVIAHTKQVFSRYSPIESIPASAGSSRTRWRFAFHSGPYARLLGVRMELAPQDDGLGATDPYSQLDIALATAPTVTVGTANVHYGSSYGAYDDVPWNFGGGVRFLDDGLGDIEWILPDTEYVGTFYDYDHARLFGATVFEVSLQPDTDDGFPRANHGAGGSILDIDRQSASTMARRLWARTAVPLWTGGSETNSTARSIVSDTTSGILSQSIGTFGLTATGTVDVQGVLSQSIGNFNLSAQGEVVGAPPAWHSTGTEASHATTVSPSWPDHTTNDIGLLFLNWSKDNTSGSTPTAPSGWSLIGANYNTETINPEVGDDYLRYHWIAIYWIRASSGAMSAPSVDMTSIGINGVNGVVLTYRGCTTSGTPYEGDTGNASVADDTALVIDNAISPGTNRLIVGAAKSISATTSGFTSALLNSPTERFDSNGMVVGDGSKTTGSNDGFTGTLSSAQPFSCLVLALKP